MPYGFRCRYQLEVFEVAKGKNTIAVLDTGSGKTLIAVMLIKHIGQVIKSTGVKKFIIFLSPTVHLVNQVASKLQYIPQFTFNLAISDI